MKGVRVILIAVIALGIAGIGILLSIIGVFLVKTHEGADQKQLLGALAKGIGGGFPLGALAASDLADLGEHR